MSVLEICPCRSDAGLLERLRRLRHPRLFLPRFQPGGGAIGGGVTPGKARGDAGTGTGGSGEFVVRHYAGDVRWVQKCGQKAMRGDACT